MSAKKTTKRQKKPTVSVRFMKPNKMFTPNLTALIRGYVYEKPVLCINCGRKARSHWTMLCPFEAVAWPKEPAFSLDADKAIPREAVTSVCDECLLHPVIPHELIEGFPLPLSKVPPYFGLEDEPAPKAATTEGGAS